MTASSDPLRTATGSQLVAEAADVPDVVTTPS